MQEAGRWSLVRLFSSIAMLGAGWVMWILIALSILSIAIMLERARLYWTLTDDLELLARDLRDLLRKNDIDGAKKRLERSPSPAATVALAGLNEADRGPEAASEAMAGASGRVRFSLERNLAFLGTVGNNAPFVGLLGTVIGIIQSFHSLEAEQSAAAAAARAGAAAAQAGQSLGVTGRVMGNLAEALVATAMGLFVAIPAVAAFNYFQRKARLVVTSGDALSHVVMAHLYGQPLVEAGAPVAASPASSGGANARKRGAAATAAKVVAKPESEADSASSADDRSKES